MKRQSKLPLVTVARRLTALLFLVLLFLGGRSGLDWLRGSLTATTAFGVVPFVDPLAALEVTLASRSFHAELLLGAALLVLLATLLGPVFCGWLCPLGLLLDLNESARGRVLRTFHRRPRPGKALRPEIRALTLGLVLGCSAAAGLPSFQLVSPINVLGWAVVFVAGPALFAVAAIAVLEWFLPRVWCRALCPLGELYSILGRHAPFKVRIDPAAAGRIQCGQCTLNCPQGIRVMEHHTLAGETSVDDPRCTRCGACIDGCPGKVLRLGFGG